MKKESFPKTIYWPFFPKLWNYGKKYAHGTIDRGLRNGPWTFWYESGNVDMQGDYKLGKKNGLWTKWWDNGHRQSQGEFQDGLMHGKWTDWYENGNKAQESFWESGRQTGEASIFDKNTGDLIKTITPRPDGVQRTFTLLTKRDVISIMRKRQKDSINRSWAALVGEKAAKFLEPWQAALWLIFAIPIYYFLINYTSAGPWSAPFAMGASGIVSTVAILLILLHDHFTRADYGAGPE